MKTEEIKEQMKIVQDHLGDNTERGYIDGITSDLGEMWKILNSLEFYPVISKGEKEALREAMQNIRKAELALFDLSSMRYGSEYRGYVNQD